MLARMRFVMRAALVLILPGLAFLYFAVGGGSFSGYVHKREPVQLTIHDKGMKIPDGYTLVEVSAFDKQRVKREMLYVQNNVSGQIYQYLDGEFMDEIKIPSGYSFVAAIGRRINGVNSTIYYCQKDGTNQIVQCSPR